MGLISSEMLFNYVHKSFPATLTEAPFSSEGLNRPISATIPEVKKHKVFKQSRCCRVSSNDFFGCPAPLPNPIYFSLKTRNQSKLAKSKKKQSRSSVRRHFRRSTKSFTLANALTLTVYCMSILHRPMPIATAVAFL